MPCVCVKFMSAICWALLGSIVTCLLCSMCVCVSLHDTEYIWQFIVIKYTHMYNSII